jgi:hypothetical protein
MRNRISFNRRSKESQKEHFAHARKAALRSLTATQSNREFAEKNEVFRGDCDAAGVEPTARQARKYRRKEGTAYNAAS